MFEVNGGGDDYTRIYVLDLSDKFDSMPTEDELKAKAETWISSNDITEPNVNLTVSFLQLGDSAEYDGIETLEIVMLCDTVAVIFSALGVKRSLKCISTTYDVLTGKYKEIELGDSTSNLADTVSSLQSSSDSSSDSGSSGGVSSEVASYISSAVSKLTSRVATIEGDYVTHAEITAKVWQTDIETALLVDTTNFISSGDFDGYSTFGTAYDWYRSASSYLVVTTLDDKPCLKITTNTSSTAYRYIRQPVDIPA